MLRIFARTGRDSDVWPVALLLFAVVAPALCLLSFMNAAMRNERLASRQKLAEAYRAQLAGAERRLDRYWEDLFRELEELARISPAPAAFAKCVESGKVDSVVLFDEKGRVAYPNTPVTPVVTPLDGAGHKMWEEANHAEYTRKDYLHAAKLYSAMAAAATNADVAARALQAQARCLARAGRKEEAIRLVSYTLGDPRYQYAADPQGRLIVANAELMALELGAEQALADRLKERLMDYANPMIAAPQRRFLMKELKKLFPKMEFPTLAAEELAAQEQRANVLEFVTLDRRVVALFRRDALPPRMKAVLGEKITLVPPGGDQSALVSLPAGSRLPGWYLALPLEQATQRGMHIYAWTALLTLAAMGVLALLAVRLLRRQAALARLKNDLVATVSHELKTPLASMRVLVDTLLEAESLDEKKAREYLQLIAGENDRLSRLIQNFLTFSRTERGQCRFHFSPVPVRPIIDAAVAAIPGRFKMEIAPDLPLVMADGDAVTTALMNLLDNATKYSGENKQIVLSGSAKNGSVLLSVRDNGVGIPAPERKHIFKPFYQIDQRLTRNGGGCGLGLSIVQSIVTAHRGRVWVESEPGCGSTFTISLPVAKGT